MLKIFKKYIIFISLMISLFIVAPSTLSAQKLKEPSLRPNCVHLLIVNKTQVHVALVISTLDMKHIFLFREFTPVDQKLSAWVFWNVPYGEYMLLVKFSDEKDKIHKIPMILKEGSCKNNHCLVTLYEEKDGGGPTDKNNEIEVKNNCYSDDS